MLVDTPGDKHLRAKRAADDAAKEEGDPRNQGDRLKRAGNLPRVGEYPHGDDRSHPRKRGEPAQGDGPRPVPAVPRTKAHRDSPLPAHKEVNDYIYNPV